MSLSVSIFVWMGQEMWILSNQEKRQPAKVE